MASEYTLTEDQMRSVAKMAMTMVNSERQEGFVAGPAPAGIPAGTFSSTTAAMAAPYETVVAASRAPPVQREPVQVLQVGAWTDPAGFGSWAAPL